MQVQRNPISFTATHGLLKYEYNEPDHVLLLLANAPVKASEQERCPWGEGLASLGCEQQALDRGPDSYRLLLYAKIADIAYGMVMLVMVLDNTSWHARPIWHSIGWNRVAILDVQPFLIPAKARINHSTTNGTADSGL